MRSGVAPHAQSARGSQDGRRDAGSNGHPQQHAVSIAAAPRPDNRAAARWDNPSVTAGDIELLRRAWDAYTRGDLEAATADLHPQVQLVRRRGAPRRGQLPQPSASALTPSASERWMKATATSR